MGAIAFGVALLWLPGRTGTSGVASSSSSGAGDSRANAGRHPRYSADVVLSIVPGSARGGPAQSAPGLSPLVDEYSRAASYLPLFTRLRNRAQRTPEEDWILAKILEQCGKKAEQKDVRGSRFSMDGEESRRRFVESLSEKDPQREKRIAAFERVRGERCAGVSGIETSESEIRSLLERAAAAGDPKAKATLLQKDLMAKARGADGRPDWDPRKLTIADAQLDAVKELFSSKDPYAISVAAALFGMPFGNLSVQTGPSEMPMDIFAFQVAGQLLACDFGAQCDQDSRQLQQACAFNGQCGAHDLREYLFYYASSPSRSQLSEEYYVHLRQAAETSDWSYFTFHRGPSPWIAPLTPRANQP